MNAELHLVDTLDDLRARCGLRATEYDVTQAAGLMRRLLLDRAPLAYTVSGRLPKKLKIIFKWYGVFGDTPDGLLIWTTAADPEMFSTLLAPQIPEARRTEQDRRLLTVATGPCEKFLRQEVIMRPTEQEHITVHGLIDQFANKLGGVHVDVNGSAVTVLNRALEQAPEMVFGAVATVGRIVVRAIEPLSAVVFDADQAARRAPEYRVRLHDPDLA